MTCHELRSLAPLYWSGEMSGEDRGRLTAHLAACPACEREMESQAWVDAQVARAAGAELPDASPVVERVRREIARGRSRRRWTVAGAIAAALLVAVGVGYELVRPAPVPRWYADAARDHRVEVMEGQPRRWRSQADEMEQVASQGGLSFAQASGLAAAGYRLERAKICGLDGQRMLHLVFGDGARRYSVYVGRHEGARTGLRTVRSGREEVAGFDTGRLRAVVVTAGPAAECEELARVAADRL